MASIVHVIVCRDVDAIVTVRATRNRSATSQQHRLTCKALHVGQEVQVLLHLLTRLALLGMHVVQLLLGRALLQALGRHSEQVAQLLLREVPALQHGTRWSQVRPAT